MLYFSGGHSSAIPLTKVAAVQGEVMLLHYTSPYTKGLTDECPGPDAADALRSEQASTSSVDDPPNDGLASYDRPICDE